MTVDPRISEWGNPPEGGLLFVLLLALLVSWGRMSSGSGKAGVGQASSCLVTGIYGLNT